VILKDPAVEEFMDLRSSFKEIAKAIQDLDLFVLNIEHGATESSSLCLPISSNGLKRLPKNHIET
jgi:hypothetical protein